MQPGWYTDPNGTQRYWDGQQWSHIPAPPSAGQQQPIINNVIHNNVGTYPPVVVTRGPNHALHLILTILTCGMWLPVWIVITATDASPAAGKTVGALFAGLFLLGVITKHPAVLIGIVPLAILGYLGYLAHDRSAERRVKEQEIAARAESENRRYMSGDLSGLYGQYPPPPPPPPPPAAPSAPPSAPPSPLA